MIGIGTRVVVASRPTAITLRSRLGIVVRIEDEDHVIVHLDTPAVYHGLDGTHTQLPDMRVMVDNLVPLRRERRSRHLPPPRLNLTTAFARKRVDEMERTLNRIERQCEGSVILRERFATIGKMRRQLILIREQFDFIDLAIDQHLRQLHARIDERETVKGK